MKLVSFLLVFVLPNISFSQSTTFKTQLQEIINDAPNGFSKYTGSTEIEEYSGDTIIYSNVTLDGTKENRIYPSKIDSLGEKIPAYYSVPIIELSEKLARREVNKWAKFLENSFYEGFLRKDYSQIFKTFGYSEGLDLIGEKINIKVYYLKPDNTKKCFVYLSVISKLNN